MSQPAPHFLHPAAFIFLPLLSFHIYRYNYSFSHKMASLEQLPQELLLLIFGAVSDANDLCSLALTGRKLYDAILEDERRVCKQVLQNQIHHDILKDLVFAWKAGEQLSRLQPRARWTPEMHRDILEQYVNVDTNMLFEDWSISKALGLTRLYGAVTYLRDAIAQRALDIAQRRYGPAMVNAEESRVTFTESCRIERALCRFELFRCLFVRQELSPRNDYEREVFWNLFAPWEREQVACVWDYFYCSLFDGTPLTSNVLLSAH